ncbi:MAG: hypothetical protein AAF702_26820 [Chloroflexota bacterium]
MAELTKRVQVLLPEEQWNELTYIAAEQKESVGHLIRWAINTVYFPQSQEENIAEKLQILDELADFNLPVADWEQMEEESVDRYAEYE